MTEPLHRESGGWTVTLVFVIIVLVIMVCALGGLTAFSFHLARQHPAATETTIAKPSSPQVIQYPPVSLNPATGSNELPMISLDDKAAAMQPEDIAEAAKVARSFISSIAINDINKMKSLSTERFQEKNRFNYLFNALMQTTGFEKVPQLISVRATGAKIELQYRTASTQGLPWDINFTLLKEEAGWKVDHCDTRGQWKKPFGK